MQRRTPPAVMNGQAQIASGRLVRPGSGVKMNPLVRCWRIVLAKPSLLHGYLAGLATVALVTLFAFQLGLNLSTTGSLYFLTVVMVAIRWGFWQASVTSLIAVNCLNYFFVSPLFTWGVSDPQNWVALGTFQLVALVVSRLSSRVQNQAREEALQRAQVEKLYELSRRILFLDRRRPVGPQIIPLIQEIFQTESAALFDATLARLDATGSHASQLEQLAREAYFQDATIFGDDPDSWAHVLRLASRPVGAIALRSPQLDSNAIVPIASLTAIALERARSFEKESRADAARQTEQLRTAVLDGLAHAFKTPLTTIRSASSGLLEAARLEPDELELVGLIDEQSDHLNRLTTELLQMARIDAAEVSLHRVPVPVASLIEAALERFQTQLAGRRVHVPDDIDNLEVYGDREILVTALEQYVDNASRYSTPGSALSITAADQLGEIVIGVHNEGFPIRAEDQQHLFERFFRAEESRHRAPGTGLGLSISQKAAEAHGGRTWVVSDERTGTTFFLAIPRGSRRQA